MIRAGHDAIEVDLEELGPKRLKAKSSVRQLGRSETARNKRTWIHGDAPETVDTWASPIEALACWKTDYLDYDRTRTHHYYAYSPGHRE
jgi:hypothetical protein